MNNPPQYPTFTRYFLGSIGLGVACGISWTLVMLNPLMQRHITKAHSILLLYGIAVFLMLCQGWMLIRWDRRLRRDRAELDAEMNRIRKELGMKP